MEVRDILAAPPQADKYDAIKKALIDRLSLSESKRLQQLLHNEELGDRTPSQLLRRLRALSNGTVSDEILRNIWTARLPSDTQKILTVSKGSVDDLAAIADQLHELRPHASVSSTSRDNSRPQSLEELERKLTDQIAALSAQLSELKTSGRSRNRSRSRPQSRSRSQSRSDPEVCWYHTTFGDKARKCNPPCKFTQGNGLGSR